MFERVYLDWLAPIAPQHRLGVMDLAFRLDEALFIRLGRQGRVSPRDLASFVSFRYRNRAVGPEVWKLVSSGIRTVSDLVAFLSSHPHDSLDFFEQCVFRHPLWPSVGPDDLLPVWNEILVDSATHGRAENLRLALVRANCLPRRCDALFSLYDAGTTDLEATVQTASQFPGFRESMEQYFLGLCRRGDEERVKAFLHRFPGIARCQGGLPLFEAVVYDRMHIVCELIQNGAVPSHDPTLCLGYACRTDWPQLARFCVEHGADIQAVRNSQIGHVHRAREILASCEKMQVLPTRRKRRHN